MGERQRSLQWEEGWKRLAVFLPCREKALRSHRPAGSSMQDVYMEEGVSEGFSILLGLQMGAGLLPSNGSGSLQDGCFQREGILPAAG